MGFNVDNNVSAAPPWASVLGQCWNLQLDLGLRLDNKWYLYILMGSEPSWINNKLNLLLLRLKAQALKILFKLKPAEDLTLNLMKWS